MKKVFIFLCLSLLILSVGAEVLSNFSFTNFYTAPAVVSLPVEESPVKSVESITVLPPACADLDVNIGSSSAVPCEDITLGVQYCNDDPVEIATGVILVVEIDPIYEITGVSVPSTVVGNQVTVDLGVLNAASCGSFNITATVSCDALPRKTYCNEVLINSDCTEAVTMGPQITTEIDCQPDGVIFTLSNVGDETWTDVNAIIIQDEIILIQIEDDTFELNSAEIIIQDEIILNQGNFDSIPAAQQLSFFVPIDPGAFLQLEIIGALGNLSIPDWVEGCEPFASSGFPLQYMESSTISTTAYFCQEIDFPAKDSLEVRVTALPQGFGMPHYIAANGGIQYTIDFKNESPKSSVSISSTISPDMDISTLVLGVSSHPYIFTQSGNQLSILIPDYNDTNGFVQFYVEQNPNNILGTIIPYSGTLSTEDASRNFNYFHTIVAEIPTALPTENFELSSITPENLTICGEKDTVTVTVTNDNTLPMAELEVHVILPNEGNGITVTDFVPQTGVTWISPLYGYDIPIFFIDALQPGESVTFDFLVQANCEIITFAEENPIAIQFDLQWNDDTALLATHTSTDNAANAAINILVPNLLLEDFINQTYTGTIGETFTRTMTITNSATEGYLEEFFIYHLPPAGLTVDSISIGEMTLSDHPDFPGYLVYALDSLDLSQVGDGDSLFESGEMLILTETVTVTGCADLTSDYSLMWGCAAEISVFCDEVTFGADVIIGNGTPIVDMEVVVEPEDYPMCAGPDNPIHVSYYFINNGTEEVPGAGTAFLGKIQLGAGVVSGSIIPYRYTQFNWNNITVNGVEAPVYEHPFENPGFIANAEYFEYSQDSFLLDIDGEGSLIDQNGDGFFWDLPVGDTLLFEFDIWRVCDSLWGENAIHFPPQFTDASLEECSSNLNFSAGGSNYFYESQCEEEFSELIQYSVRMQKLNFGTELTEFPSDIFLNEPFNIGYKVGEEWRNITACPEDSMFVEIVLPAGFSLVPEGTFMIESYAGELAATNSTTQLPIPVVSTQGNVVTLLLNSGRPSPVGSEQDRWQYCLNLQIVYDDNSSGCASQEDILELFAFSTCASCADCVAKWNEDCQEIVVQTHIDGDCGGEFPGGGFGLKTLGFDLSRINYDPYQDPFESQPTDPETYNNRAGIPGDTVRAVFPAVFLGDPLAEYDSIMVEVCYQNAIRTRWLDFFKGSTTYSNGETTYENDEISAPIETAETVSWDSLNRCYRFNISDAVQDASSLVSGDSLLVTLDFEILFQDYISYETGGRDFVEDWTGHVFLMKDNDQFSTDIYGNLFEFSQTWLVGNAQAPVSPEACEGHSWMHGANQNWVYSNGSAALFPNEFRQEAEQDSIIVIVPDTWVVANDSFVLVTLASTLDVENQLPQSTTTYQTIEADTTYDDITGQMILTFRNGYNGTDWQPFEVFTENRWKQAIAIEFLPTCATQATINNLDLKNTPIAHTYNREFPDTNLEMDSFYRTYRPVIYTPPVFELSPISVLQTPATPEVFWDLEWSNLNNLPSENAWFAFENTSGQTDIITLIETTDNINDTIELEDYYVDADTFVWAKIGELSAADNRTFRAFGAYQDCGLDSINVYQSYGCIGYPDSPAATTCRNTQTVLEINPQPAELQIDIIESPPMPTDLCAELDYEIKITNINFGSANKLELTALLPAVSSLEYVEGSSELSFPAGETFISISDPNIEDNVVKWQLSLEIDSPLWGIAHPDSNEINVRFRLKTGCPFISGDLLTFFANAENNCGSIEEAVTNSPEPISINGLETSGTSLNFIVLAADDLTPCADAANLRFQLKNTGDFSTIGNEELELLLPESIDWTTTELSILAGEEYLQSALPLQSGELLNWKLNAGFLPDSVIIWELHLQTTNNEFDCANFTADFFLKEVTEVNCSGGIPCAVENPLSDFTQNINVELAEINFANLDLQTSSAGADSVWLNYNLDLINNNGATAMDYNLAFYSETDLIHTETLPVTLLNGETISQAGVFKAAAAAVCPIELIITGCSCAAPVVVSTFPTFTDTIQVSLCAGEEYNFNGEILNEEGIFCQDILSPNTCDSLLCVQVEVLDTFNITTTHAICAGETYDFSGMEFNTTGFYCQDFIGINGCDSTHCIDLTVLDTFFVNQAMSLCAGEEYDFNGEILSTTGLFCQDLTAQNGCDSMHCIDLTVLDTFLVTDVVSLCAGEEYDFNGEILSTTGLFCQDLTAQNGCDSMHCIDLTVLDTFLVTDVVSLCAGEEYDFNGEILSTTELFCQDLIAQNGCDSIHCIDLTVLDTFFVTNVETICAGEEYDFNGEILSTTGIFCQDLTAQNGCDSMHCVDLTVLDTFFVTELMTVCAGEEYDFNGEILNTTDIFCQNFTAQNGCDSTHCISLTVLDTFYVTEQITLCAGEELDFNGEILNTNSITCAVFMAQNGCDSTHCIILEILPEILTEEFAEYCAEDEFTFNGQVLNQAGVYFFDTLLISAFGCDSLHTAEFTIHPRPTVEIVFGPQNLWAGQQVTLEAESPNIVNFAWTPSEELSCDNCPSPQVSPSAATLYTVMVTDDNGCIASDTVSLFVRICEDAEIEVPNMITPNGDGNNDNFWLYKQEGIDRLDFIRVWDRWGNLVFETTNLNDKWDGKYQGETVNPGVFAYHIKGICISGEKLEMQGNVTVIR